ncbi:hypothetical protein [Kribbella sp. NPDC006257]|uniref:hypothetical protein n=1 Tax=Kribbella sp. NPDC006257 TaxID=3156738 RepID=UPI0033A1BB2D
MGTAACSSDKSSSSTPEDKPAASGSTQPTAKASDVGATSTTPIKAAAVVSAFTAAGYKCSSDGTYAICTSGPASVWVLTGDHPRPPVVSLHSAGPIATASAAIAKVLPQALEIAHIGQSQEITDWFAKQSGKTAAQMSAGDWQIDYSAELDTEEPGAHLSLMDKLCKTNCTAE